MHRPRHRRDRRKGTAGSGYSAADCGDARCDRSSVCAECDGDPVSISGEDARTGDRQTDRTPARIPDVCQTGRRQYQRTFSGDDPGKTCDLQIPAWGGGEDRKTPTIYAGIALLSLTASCLSNSFLFRDGGLADAPRSLCEQGLFPCVSFFRFMTSWYSFRYLSIRKRSPDNYPLCTE